MVLLSLRLWRLRRAKSQTLEQLFESLDQVVNKLEDGNISLEESFKTYNEGMKLIKACNSQLDKVEKQIIVLNDGEEM